MKKMQTLPEWEREFAKRAYKDGRPRRLIEILREPGSLMLDEREVREAAADYIEELEAWIEQLRVHMPDRDSVAERMFVPSSFPEGCICEGIHQTNDACQIHGSNPAIDAPIRRRLT